MPKAIIRPDRKYYVPVIDGKRQMLFANTCKDQSMDAAKRFGLKNWTIEEFWGSEYE